MNLRVTNILSERRCFLNKSDTGSELNTYTRVILSAEKREEKEDTDRERDPE